MKLMIFRNTYEKEVDDHLWNGYKEISKDAHKIYFEVLHLVVLEKFF